MTLQDAAKLAKHANVANAKRFAKHVVPEVMRPARVVWNQAIGALFILLASSAGLWGFRNLRSDSKSIPGLVLCGIFCTVMLVFGISSFLKARRVALRINRR